MNATDINGRVDNLSLAHDMARKEHAHRAAQAGWILTCRDRRLVSDHRQSMDLSPEQPVLVGDALCYATGWEDDGEYEVRLGSVYGPYLHVKQVRAMTEGNYRHLRAVHLADALADQLMRLKWTADADKQFYADKQRIAEDMMIDLTRH